MSGKKDAINGFLTFISMTITIAIIALITLKTEGESILSSILDMAIQVAVAVAMVGLGIIFFILYRLRRVFSNAGEHITQNYQFYIGLATGIGLVYFIGMLLYLTGTIHSVIEAIYYLPE